MKISDVTVTLFAWDDLPARQFGRHTGRMAGGRSELGLVTIRTDDDVEDHSFLGSSSRGDAARHRGPLTRELTTALGTAQLREQLTGLGVDPWPGSAEELGALLRADIERYGQIARSAGLSKQ